MAKTNFTKVEDALEKGLQKAKVDKLLDLADDAAAKRARENPTEPTPAKAELLEEKEARTAIRQLQKAIQVDLQWLYKQDKTLYQRLGIEKGELQKLLKEEPAQLTPEKRQQLETIRSTCQTFREELKQKLGTEAEAELIEKERRRQTTRRFNVRDKWLPLK